MDKRPGFRKRIFGTRPKYQEKQSQATRTTHTLLGMYASLQRFLPSLRQRLPRIGRHEGHADGRFSESNRRYNSSCRSQ